MNSRRHQLSLLSPSGFFTLYLASIFMRPWELFDQIPIFRSLPMILLGLAGVSTLILALLEPRSALLRLEGSLKKEVLSAVALGGWIFILTFKATSPMAAQELYFLSIFRSIGIFLLTVFLIRSEDDYLRVSKWVVYSVMVITVFALHQNFSGIQQSSRLQSKGLFADPNDLSSILVMTLPIGLRTLRPFWRPILLGIWLLGIMKSSSRGALMGLGVLGVAATLAQLKTKSHRLIAMFALILALFFGSAQMGRDSDDLDQSASSRTNYWLAGVNMMIRQPLTGVGFGNYPIEYERYAPEILYEWGERTAHSTWILILAETGLIGTGIFLSLSTSVLRKAWKVRLSRPELFLSLLGYGTCMSFLSHSYTIFPWFIFALTLAGTRNHSLADGRPHL